MRLIFFSEVSFLDDNLNPIRKAKGLLKPDSAIVSVESINREGYDHDMALIKLIDGRQFSDNDEVYDGVIDLLTGAAPGHIISDLPIAPIDSQ